MAKRLGILLGFLCVACPIAVRSADVVPMPFESHATYQTCFAPGSDCERMILDVIGSATRQIHMQAYSFTDRAIASALIDASHRGVEVVVLLDKSQRHQRYSVAADLFNAGIKTLIDERPAIAHNKTIIIDPSEAAPAVETGSFNFTYSAEHRNAENVLIVRGDRELVAAYERYFQERMAVSQPW